MGKFPPGPAFGEDGRQYRQFSDDAFCIENAFHAFLHADVAGEVHGIGVGSVWHQVADGEWLDGKIDLDGSFKQVGMEGKHVALGGGGAFREEDAPFFCIQVADESAKGFFEVPAAGSVQVQGADFPAQIAHDGPVRHCGLGDEMPIEMGIDQEDVQP